MNCKDIYIDIFIILFPFHLLFDLKNNFYVIWNISYSHWTSLPYTSILSLKMQAIDLWELKTIKN